MPVLLIARRSDDYQHDVLITPLLLCSLFLFFFNDTATTEIYTLSLHDALPIYSTNKREEGFLAVMKENPGIEVVSSNQYAGEDVESAYRKAEAILSTYKRPDGSLGVNGIFCPNESSAFGMLRVLQDNGWAGKVHFVGFDASPNLVKGLRDGHIDGLVLQDPVSMGYLGVKTMVAHLRGQSVEKRIDTGVHLATREAMDQPEMKELLSPGLSKWLKN